MTKTAPFFDNRLNRRGYGVVDLLMSVALIAILSVLALPIIQEMRAAARDETCEARLAALAYDASAYHLTYGRLPSSLGVPGATRWGDWISSSSEDFYGRQQNSSPIANGIKASGRLRQLTGERDPIDTSFWDFDSPLGDNVSFWNFDGYLELIQLNAPFFRCPAIQTFKPTAGYIIAVQPVYVDTPDEEEDYLGPLDDTDPWIRYGVTNYVGCLGAGNGGSIGVDSLRRRYRGMISSRESVTYQDVNEADGLSQTIMYGENIGSQRRDLKTCVRTVSYLNSWVGGGIVRGRGVVNFMADPPLSSEPTKNYPKGFDPDSTILGRLGFSSVFGFGSGHRDGVNFVFGDGHVTTLSRDMDWQVLYAAFGAFDSEDNNF